VDKLLAQTNFYVPGMFISNVLLAWIVIEILRNYSKRERSGNVETAEPVSQAAHHKVRSE